HRRIGEAQFLRGLPGTRISDFCVWIPTCPLVRPISHQFAVELLDCLLCLETARIVQDPNARCEVDDPPVVIGRKCGTLRIRYQNPLRFCGRTCSCRGAISGARLGLLDPLLDPNPTQREKRRQSLEILLTKSKC